MDSATPSLHPLHRLWRLLPPDRRRRMLAGVAARLAPKPDKLPPACCDGVIVGGEVGRPSGLGQVARIMHQALQSMEVPAFLLQAGLDAAAERSAAQAREPGGRPGPAAALVLHVNAPVLPASLLRLPRGLVRRRRVVGYWHWELGVVPETWRPACACVHEIWVPSRFTAAALEPLMPGRVRVVPHALALAPPVPGRFDRDSFGLPADAVVVLVSFSLASAFERKNPLAAIAAFRKAFGDRADRILLLKVGHAEHYPDDMRRLRAAIAGSANIRLQVRMLAEPESHALTSAADIVLSLHRSEAFGLIPAEAMLLGRAVIATDWSATSEFLDASCGVPIACRLVPARDPRGIFEAPGAVWAEADTDDAARALQMLADHPEQRTRLGDAARNAAASRFGGEALRHALAGIGYRRPSH